MRNDWYEVWADESLLDVPYLLLLRPSSMGFEVIDPAKGNKMAFESLSYEHARIWLLKDEYVFVARKESDDVGQASEQISVGNGYEHARNQVGSSLGNRCGC